MEHVEIRCQAGLLRNEMVVRSVHCLRGIPLLGLPCHGRKYSQFGSSLSKTLVCQRGASPACYVAHSAPTPALEIDLSAERREHVAGGCRVCVDSYVFDERLAEGAQPS
jgi:hypothetical protein